MPNVHCNFCFKGNEEVKILIAGINVFICNECVQHCNEIIAEEDKKEQANA